MRVSFFALVCATAMAKAAEDSWALDDKIRGRQDDLECAVSPHAIPCPHLLTQGKITWANIHKPNSAYVP